MTEAAGSPWRLFKWPSVVLFVAMVVAGFGNAVKQRGMPPDIRTGYNAAVATLTSSGGVPVEQLRAALAISVNERHVQRYNLAVALMSEGRLDEAKKELEIATARRPDYWLAHRDLGRLLMKDDPAGAAKHLEQAASGLGDLKVWVLVGDARRKQGAADRAILAYQTALKMGSRSLVTRCKLLVSLLESKRTAEAGPFAQAALRPSIDAGARLPGWCLEAVRATRGQ